MHENNVASQNPCSGSKSNGTGGVTMSKIYAEEKALQRQLLAFLHGHIDQEYRVKGGQLVLTRYTSAN